jgi:hypothetical protein
MATEIKGAATADDKKSSDATTASGDIINRPHKRYKLYGPVKVINSNDKYTYSSYGKVVYHHANITKTIEPGYEVALADGNGTKYSVIYPYERVSTATLDGAGTIAVLYYNASINECDHTPVPKVAVTVPEHAIDPSTYDAALKRWIDSIATSGHGHGTAAAAVSASATRDKHPRAAKSAAPAATPSAASASSSTSTALTTGPRGGRGGRSTRARTARGRLNTRARGAVRAPVPQRRRATVAAAAAAADGDSSSDTTDTVVLRSPSREYSASPQRYHHSHDHGHHHHHRHHQHHHSHRHRSRSSSSSSPSPSYRSRRSHSYPRSRSCTPVVTRQHHHSHHDHHHHQHGEPIVYVLPSTAMQPMPSSMLAPLSSSSSMMPCTRVCYS